MQNGLKLLEYSLFNILSLKKITSIPVFSNTKEETIYEKYLHVNVTPSAAVEFQHFQNKIIEKINSFFGI